MPQDHPDEPEALVQGTRQTPNPNEPKGCFLGKGSGPQTPRRAAHPSCATRRPASSSPPTAPDGGLNTPCLPASAQHSSRIASAPPSTCDSSIFIPSTAPSRRHPSAPAAWQAGWPPLPRLSPLDGPCAATPCRLTNNFMSLLSGQPLAVQGRVIIPKAPSGTFGTAHLLRGTLSRPQDRA
jgi:hypothetical protein